MAKSLILAHGAEVMGIEDGFRGLIERRARPLGLREVGGIIVRGGTILGADNRTNPFRWRERGDADVSDLVLEHARDLGLDGLVVLGGDGTMSLAHRFQQQGLPIVGVPKTIDNDLVGTERTIGFDTAVAIAAESVDRIHTTTQSHHRVFVVETMGRGAGWLALHAGLASGADIILLPEIAFDLAAVLEVCRKREGGGPRFTIIVAAEGASPIGGTQAIRAAPWRPRVPEARWPGGAPRRAIGAGAPLGGPRDRARPRAARRRADGDGPGAGHGAGRPCGLPRRRGALRADGGGAGRPPHRGPAGTGRGPDRARCRPARRSSPPPWRRVCLWE